MGPVLVTVPDRAAAYAEAEFCRDLVEGSISLDFPELIDRKSGCGCILFIIYPRLTGGKLI